MPTAISEADQIYCDASALVKLIAREEESSALRSFVRGRLVITSELSLAEVPRAVRRRKLGATALRNVESLFEGLELVTLTREILLRAANYRDPGLRSLDAIHLASAEDSRASLDQFVSYDRRQIEAATAAGIAVHSPA